MFGSEDLRKTRFAQELIQETKLEIVPPLLSKGFSVEKVAEILKLTPEQVREHINKTN
jgi:predicted transposase YdaD